MAKTPSKLLNCEAVILIAVPSLVELMASIFATLVTKFTNSVLIFAEVSITPIVSLVAKTPSKLLNCEAVILIAVPSLVELMASIFATLVTKFANSVLIFAEVSITPIVSLVAKTSSKLLNCEAVILIAVPSLAELMASIFATLVTKFTNSELIFAEVSITPIVSLVAKTPSKLLNCVAVILMALLLSVALIASTCAILVVNKFKFAVIFAAVSKTLIISLFKIVLFCVLNSDTDKTTPYDSSDPLTKLTPPTVNTSPVRAIVVYFESPEKVTLNDSPLAIPPKVYVCPEAVTNETVFPLSEIVAPAPF